MSLHNDPVHCPECGAHLYQKDIGDNHNFCCICGNDYLIAITDQGEPSTEDINEEE